MSRRRHRRENWVILLATLAMIAQTVLIMISLL